MNIRAVDFLRPTTSPPLGWWLLGAGVVALGFALWCDSRWGAERTEALRLSQLRAEVLRARLQPAPPPVPNATQQRWQQARVELQRPWISALHAVESATTDPIYLLSLTVEPSSGLLKLEAEAPSFEEALDYARILEQWGTLQRTALSTHEQATDAASGRSIVRFTLTTHWNAR